MLRALHLKDVGPAARFDLERGERLNVLTGDNGLGKSFILDVAWWALTGTWVKRPVLPRRGKEETAEMRAEVWIRNLEEHEFSSRFVRVGQSWEDPYRQQHSAALVARNLMVPTWVDGADPVLYMRAAERIVVLIEEPETHLHPKWQRHIFPALIDVLTQLSPGMKPQILATTHSPPGARLPGAAFQAEQGQAVPLRSRGARGRSPRGALG